MRGLILTVEQFVRLNSSDVVSRLCELYPNAEQSQVRSWQVLAEDVLTSTALSKLPRTALICFEFSLPTDDMAVDLIVAGKNKSGRSVACLVESKQWSDDYILRSRFSTHRSVGSELHPQIQVERHSLSFRDYLDIGSNFEVRPFVFLRNATNVGLDYMVSHNPRGINRRIPICLAMDEVLLEAASMFVECSCLDIKSGLEESYLKPCKSIFDAMKSIVTNQASGALGHTRWICYTHHAVQEWMAIIAQSREPRLGGLRKNAIDNLQI